MKKAILWLIKFFRVDIPTEKIVEVEKVVEKEVIREVEKEVIKEVGTYTPENGVIDGNVVINGDVVVKGNLSVEGKMNVEGGLNCYSNNVKKKGE